MTASRAAVESAAERPRGRVVLLGPLSERAGPALAAFSMIGVGFPQHARKTDAHNAAAGPARSGSTTAGMGRAHVTHVVRTVRTVRAQRAPSDRRELREQREQNGSA